MVSVADNILEINAMSASPRWGVDQLLLANRQIAAEAADASARWTGERIALAEQLTRAGMNAAEVEQLIDVYEKMWSPSVGASGSRHPGNDVARHLHDMAARAGVSASVWSTFVASLADHRKVEDRANKISAALYSAGGFDTAREARVEAEEIMRLRDDVFRQARKMLPGIDFRSVNDRFFEDQDKVGVARFDPLKKIVSYSMGMANGDDVTMRQKMFTQMWQTIEPQLSNKEREVLLRRMSPNAAYALRTGALKSEDVTEHIGKLFAENIAPRRSSRRKSFFQPLKFFAERVSNAASGLGFQTAEDIFNRAKSGDVASRSGPLATSALRVNKESGQYGLAKESVKSLSDFELRKMIRLQMDELDRCNIARRSLMSQMITYNPAVRGLKSVVNYFNPTAEDALKRDIRTRNELSRGLGLLKAELRGREQREVDMAITGHPNGHNDPERPKRSETDVVRPITPFTVIEGGVSNATAAIAEMISGTKAGVDAENRPAVGFADLRVAPIEGHIRTSNAGSYNYDNANLSIIPTGTDQAVALGIFNDLPSAHHAIDAFERMVGVGEASTLAKNMAEEMNRQGPGDIKWLRASGKLDPSMDAAISAVDNKAFAYPLKPGRLGGVGEVIFQGADNQWRAASMSEFIGYAISQSNIHLKNAAEVMAAGPDNSPPTMAADRDRNDGLTPELRSASFPVGPDAMKLGIHASETEKQAFVRQVHNLDNQSLTDAYKTNWQAREDISLRLAAISGQARNPADVRRKLELDSAAGHLNAEMKRRGLADTSRTAGEDGAYGISQKLSKKRGNSL